MLFLPPKGRVSDLCEKMGTSKLRQILYAILFIFNTDDKNRHYLGTCFWTEWNNLVLSNCLIIAEQLYQLFQGIDLYESYEVD